MIEPTNRAGVPVPNLSRWLLATRLPGFSDLAGTDGGILQFVAKRQFLNGNTASIGSPMSLILKGRKSPNPGKNAFRLLGISLVSERKDEELEGPVRLLKSFPRPEFQHSAPQPT